MPCLRAAGWRLVGLDSTPRSQQRRGGSKLRGPAGSVVSESTICQGIQLAGKDVAFKLAVPSVRVELREPFTENTELLRGKLPDLPLNHLYLAHQIPTPS